MRFTIFMLVFCLFLGLVFVVASTVYMSDEDVGPGGVIVFLLGLVFIGVSYLVASDVFSGYMASPCFLNEKIIYRVEGQIKTSDGGNTFIVRNATGRGGIRWVKNPEPLASDVHLVKVAKTEKGRHKLIPFKEEMATSAQEANKPIK